MDSVQWDHGQTVPCAGMPPRRPACRPLPRRKFANRQNGGAACRAGGAACRAVAGGLAERLGGMPGGGAPCRAVGRHAGRHCGAGRALYGLATAPWAALQADTATWLVLHWFSSSPCAPTLAKNCERRSPECDFRARRPNLSCKGPGQRSSRPGKRGVRLVPRHVACGGDTADVHAAHHRPLRERSDHWQAGHSHAVRGPVPCRRLTSGYHLRWGARQLWGAGSRGRFGEGVGFGGLLALLPRLPLGPYLARPPSPPTSPGRCTRITGHPRYPCPPCDAHAQAAGGR